jgi:hypothetical protein
MAEQHDPDISRKYRELGAEQPPRALDEAILAASRRAVDSRPAPLVVPTGRGRWYFPVAAAAVIMLAVAVTVQVEKQKPDDEIVVATAPPEASKEEPAVPAERKRQAFKAPIEQAKPAPKPFAAEPPPAAAAPSADAMRDLAKSNEAATAAQGARPAEVPAQARSRSDAAETRRMEGELQVKPAAPPASAPQAKPAPAAEMTGVASAMLQVSPELWLEQIAELRKHGKHEAADKALAEFRKRYPDYRLSVETRAKVEKK